MTDQKRSLEYEVEVIGSPEQVWRAIATSGGITSWFVPHTVEEREGGEANARFGPGESMEVPGRVAAYDPPNRFVIDGGDPDEGLAFEWLVEARDGGTCSVRLINTGFGTGEEWDAMYDGMESGWRMFLRNLQLHLERFSGQSATASLPGGMWPGEKAEMWKRFTEGLGVAQQPTVGERVALKPTAELELSGEVAEVTEWWFLMVVDQPAPGTAFVALEGTDGQLNASVWSYLYGDEGAAVSKRDEPLWQDWLAGLAES